MSEFDGTGTFFISRKHYSGIETHSCKRKISCGWESGCIFYDGSGLRFDLLQKQRRKLCYLGIKDGIQHYYERFPDQLKIMYDGKKGFLYRPISNVSLTNTNGHTWESKVDVPVLLHEHILNVYAEIFKEEAAGNVIIHRYNEIDPDEQKMHANYLRDHINDPLFDEYRHFIFKHFSSLWDESNSHSS